MFKNIITFLLLSCSLTVVAQHIEILQQGKPTSIRGLSVVDDNVVWISGSNGYFARSTDGGKTWDWQQVKGFEKADFRDIEAFSAKEAMMMSSGTPALILKTIDGGNTWQVKYRNADTAYFLDAMAFYDKQHGYVLGDPINKEFFVLFTQDNGETWTKYTDVPIMLAGEAAFAASGTCLNILPDNNIAIVSGGKTAKVYLSQLKHSWKQQQIPIINGNPSQGAFSIAIGTKQMVIVGGDYQHDKRTDSTACYSTDNGSTWHIANTPPPGYQSCAEYIDGETFLSTGTPGSCITTDGGKTWIKIDDISYNVCKKAKHGKLVFLAGNTGKIGILKP